MPGLAADALSIEREAAGATHTLADAIDDLLPQTQCRRCGHSGCRPYAEAIAGGEVPINRCPPGGVAGVARLAALLGTPALALDPACGVEGPRSVARIEAALCIGCTKCIQACPVDAIIGANRRMHTVIAELCTGCKLCLPPCPVDCIVIEPLVPQPTPVWSEAEARDARRRHRARSARLERVRVEREQRLAARARARLDALATESATALAAEHTDAPADLADASAEPPASALVARKRAIIEAAIQRARDRATARATRPTGTTERAR